MVMAKDKPKHAGGRPTKYLPESSDKVTEYMTNCELDGELPTLAGLALYLDTTKTTVQNWRKQHPEFLTSLAKMLQKQQQMLINKGLNKDYNPLITKLILSANHGMSEKTITEHEVSEETATLLGMIDGSSKGKLPTKQEEQDAG